MANAKQYLVALDAGGTMTDTFFVDEDGAFVLGKALTNPDDESESYMESVRDAAEIFGITREELHQGALNINYAGTGMLNCVLTRSGRNVGLLTTRGFEDHPFLDRGLTWLGKSYEDTMHSTLHEHPPRLIKNHNFVKGISERVLGPSYYAGAHYPADTVIIPLNEKEVRQGTEELLDAGANVIGILFLHSYIVPKHEKRAAEIARQVVTERGLDVPVVTSHEICPVAFENARLKSLLIQCYAGVKATETFMRIESGAKKEGFSRDLQTLLSYGATVNIRYPRIYESIISGPTGGMLGALKLMKGIKGLDDVVCADLGGTTWDVGIIARGQLPVNKEPDFLGHRVNLPMVAIDSIGAGTGQQIHVDAHLKRITLGPESAGSKVGTCYKYSDITVGDVDVVLGYLNPDNFLGGKVKVHRDVALKRLEEDLAKPLGGNVYDLSCGVLDLLHSGMREFIKATLLSRGYDPLEFTLVVYGGGGPLHLWGVAEQMEFAGVCTVPWAAAFSAYGVATADYFHRYERSVLCTLPPTLIPEEKLAACGDMDAAWREMEATAYKELEAEGYSSEHVSFSYGISARYLGQMASWDSEFAQGRFKTAQDVDDAIAGFEKAYATVYPTAAQMPEAGYAFTGVTLKAMVNKVQPVIAKHALVGPKPSKHAHKGQREVYHRKWTTFDIWDMDSLQPGNRIDGPSIIEHSMTTMVIPPENYVEFDEHKVMWYKKK